MGLCLDAISRGLAYPVQASNVEVSRPNHFFMMCFRTVRMLEAGIFFTLVLAGRRPGVWPGCGLLRDFCSLCLHVGSAWVLMLPVAFACKLVVLVDVNEDKEGMVILRHGVEVTSVSPEPGERLLSDAGVDTLQT